MRKQNTIGGGQSMILTGTTARRLATAAALAALPLAASAATYGLTPFTIVVAGTDEDGDSVVDNGLDGTYDVAGRIVTDGSLGLLDPMTAILSAEAVATRRSDGSVVSLLVLPREGDAALLEGGATLGASLLELELALGAGPGGLAFETEDGRFGYGGVTGDLDGDGTDETSIEAFISLPSLLFDGRAILVPGATAGVIATAPLPGALGLALTGLAALWIAARRRG